MRLHSGICPCCTESRMRVMSLCFGLLGDGFGFVVFLIFFFSPRLFFIKVVLCIHRLSFFEYAYIYTYFDPPLIKLLLSPLCSRLIYVWNAKVSPNFIQHFGQRCWWVSATNVNTGTVPLTFVLAIKRLYLTFVECYEGCYSLSHLEKVVRFISCIPHTYSVIVYRIIHVYIK